MDAAGDWTFIRTELDSKFPGSEVQSFKGC
jgi:hypothetical protein